MDNPSSLILLKEDEMSQCPVIVDYKYLGMFPNNNNVKLNLLIRCASFDLGDQIGYKDTYYLITYYDIIWRTTKLVWKMYVIFQLTWQLSYIEVIWGWGKSLSVSNVQVELWT